MLHLAQVQKNNNSGKLELEILAQKITENEWEVNKSLIISTNNLNVDDKSFLKEGLLILIELDNTQKIASLKLANEWILELITKIFSQPILNEEFVKKEQEKVEKWRQEMALQSQTLTRRSLELEIRQEQLQALEEKLKQQEENLELKEK